MQFRKIYLTYSLNQDTKREKEQKSPRLTLRTETDYGENYNSV